MDEFCRPEGRETRPPPALPGAGAGPQAGGGPCPAAGHRPEAGSRLFTRTNSTRRGIEDTPAEVHEVRRWRMRHWSSAGASRCPPWRSRWPKGASVAVGNCARHPSRGDHGDRFCRPSVSYSRKGHLPMPRLSATEVVRAQKAHRHYSAVRAMHRVAKADADLAARLHAIGREIRNAAQASKNPQELTAPEGSTAHHVHDYGMRAADGQSDTHRPL